MLLIKNGHIKPMVGEDIERGYVLIGDDGKIAALGSGESSVQADTVIDAEGHLVTPGCVEPHSHIGLWNSVIKQDGLDLSEKTDPISPQLRAIDGIYPQEEEFKEAVKGGITTACTGPGSCNVVGGTFAAIKTYGNRVDDMIVKYPMAMKCAFGENPKGVYGVGRHAAPMTRTAVASMLRSLLIRSRNYLKMKESGKEPAFDPKLEAMIPVLKKEIPLKAHAHRADDILTSIRIAKEFDLLLTLDHCTDGEVIAEELAKEGYPAFVGPTLGRKSKSEVKNKAFSTAGVLHKAGVKVSITTDSPETPIEFLPLCAGLAVRDGLPYEEGWRAITINPAEANGIADRVGSLEVGKDGDVVVWSDDPLLAVAARSLYTVIDGRIVYQA
ncbi:MAG: amidohydrolase [Ruminococcaceae bacterium]|nr:amidohydrolase [Oscillospiraceae bacterium]